MATNSCEQFIVSGDIIVMYPDVRQSDAESYLWGIKGGIIYCTSGLALLILTENTLHMRVLAVQIGHQSLTVISTFILSKFGQCV